MKLLVLLAVLGVAAAQYKVYSGLLPHHAYNYGALPYSAPYSAGVYSPYTYSPLTYAASPFHYSGLPYAFKPVKVEEEKPAETPVVEATRKKRDTLPKTGSVAIHAANTFPYAYNYPGLYSGAAYNYAAPTTYAAATYPLTYSGFHAYSPLVRHLKKRDTAAAEDQEADDATLYSTYATHPYAYNALPYTAASSVYHNTALPYNYGLYNNVYRPYNFGAYRYVY